ncbi:putative glycosyltransferase RT0329 [Planktothrix tepida]|uniref:Glycosyl transferase family protein n=1 Tax=Planktothrix tepida PCC 9214 TaxID=671072 RepID=A0A1J1LFS4_9CYAN|nr:glycosyltransferase [Planktothrix tepida]CAD5928847.1 putative glycosyltransferase RT0329 [Planktothrix tepida]CUR31447.1 Glycosyl transferase family protein [Planktothrix tepida PCC 9214]
MARVSVIIPTYNCDRFLPEAIDSVLMQTYQDYEIIVIDDGSTDETRQVLESYQNKIRYFYQQNQGSAVARNLGIKQAKGELIAFLDADDFWIVPEKLAEQVNCFEQQPSLGSVHTGWQIVDAGGDKIIDVEPWREIPDLNLESWLMYKPVKTSGMIIRQNWLQQAGGFDGELRQSHDVDLVLRLALIGCEAAWWRRVAVGYRRYGGNTTRNTQTQAECLLNVLNKFFAHGDLPEPIQKIESQVHYHTLVWIAWYQYEQGFYDEMARFLNRSLEYSPYYKMETISDWVEQFKKFSIQNGLNFDICLLMDLPDWQQLMFRIMEN